jgi:hypothetical protein
MVVQDLFRQRLVAGDHQSARIAARVRDLNQLEIADHVLVKHRFAPEFLQQVEDNVRLELFQRLAQRRHVVVEPERPHLVIHLAQGRDHVILGLVLQDFGIGPAGDVIGRHEIGMHQHENAPLAHAYGLT